jgi:bifunctional pyridoxal-dependent enzyme with beta-cystathionase and maltose regulon repressor activities
LTKERLNAILVEKNTEYEKFKVYGYQYFEEFLPAIEEWVRAQSVLEVVKKEVAPIETVVKPLIEETLYEKEVKKPGFKEKIAAAKVEKKIVKEELKKKSKWR